MSTVQITIVEVSGTATTGESVPVASSRLIGTPEVISSTASSQATTLVADANTIEATRLDRYYWRIAIAGDEDVYVAFGSAPTASSTAGLLCLAGGVYEFRLRAVGDKVAVINLA